MLYLVETYWAWSLVSLFGGGAVGYWWLRNPPLHSVVKGALVVVAIGLLVVALRLLPGRAGLYLETLLLLLLVYIVGVLLGAWLRRGNVAPHLPAYAGPVARGDRGQRPAIAAAEDARIAAEAKAAEDARIAAAAEAAEGARIAAEAMAAEDARIVAEAKAAEDARMAADAKAAEDARIAAEAKAAEDARIAAEAKAAEHARRVAEVNVSDAEQDADAEGRQEALAAPHPGVRPAGIAAPRDGKADDLKLIKGIGPKNEGICNDLGIYRLAQIADWTADEATWVGHHIAFPGRVEREHWVDQAKLLAAGGQTEHSAGVRAGTIRLDTVTDDPLDDAEVLALRASMPAQAASVEGESEHHGRRPYGLLSPRDGHADDLQRIRGIGPQNERRLHALGIWHFNQIAAWSVENVAWIGSYLAFSGRIDREKWIDQAKDLAGSGNGESSKRKSTKSNPLGGKRP